MESCLEMEGGEEEGDEGHKKKDSGPSCTIVHMNDTLWRCAEHDLHYSLPGHCNALQDAMGPKKG